MTEFVFHNSQQLNHFLKAQESKLPFSHKSGVSITHEQNILCNKTKMDGIMHEQSIICKQLFAGHVVGSRPMKRKSKMHRMIMIFIIIDT